MLIAQIYAGGSYKINLSDTRVDHIFSTEGIYIMKSVNMQLISFFENFRLLSESHFGFGAKRSTDSA